jgi:aromatic ring-opening dioxygenase LigB subunit
LLEAMEIRVAVVVSADLAHTHLKSGPYGRSPAAEPFDAACMYLTQTLLHRFSQHARRVKGGIGPHVS